MGVGVPVWDHVYKNQDCSPVGVGRQEEHMLGQVEGHQDRHWVVERMLRSEDKKSVVDRSSRLKLEVGCLHRRSACEQHKRFRLRREPQRW